MSSPVHTLSSSSYPVNRSFCQLHSVSCPNICWHIIGFTVRKHGDLNRAAAFSSSTCGQIATRVPLILRSVKAILWFCNNGVSSTSVRKAGFRLQRARERAVGQAAQAAWHVRPISAADTATAARRQDLKEPLSRRLRHVAVRRNASSCDTDGCE